MKNILVAGGTGMVGERLTTLLSEKGYATAVLSRSKSSIENGIFNWDIENNKIDSEAIAWADAIINLAGAGIADKRWTEARKKVITESRTKSNHFLLSSCLEYGKLPEVYLSAGGMNFYGDSRDQILTENSPKGSVGFLPKSCEAWEKAVSSWAQKGVRTIQYRISIVLSTKGGALPKMAMTAPIGIVPYFGNGQQWYSWIHIDDLCRLFIKGLEDSSMSGIFNAASPEPVTNKEIAKAILKANTKIGITPSVPSIFMKLGLGEMSETVLSSVRLSVDKIASKGFKWEFPDIASALKDLNQRKI